MSFSERERGREEREGVKESRAPERPSEKERAASTLARVPDRLSGRINSFPGDTFVPKRERERESENERSRSK